MTTLNSTFGSRGGRGEEGANIRSSKVIHRGTIPSQMTQTKWKSLRSGERLLLVLYNYYLCIFSFLIIISVCLLLTREGSRLNAA